VDDTVELMRALVARDEASVELGCAARLRRSLRGTDLSRLRAPLLPLLLLVALAPVGAAALAPGGGIVAAARAGLAAVPDAIGAATAAALPDPHAAALLAAAVAGPALLLVLVDLLADLRRTFFGR
jgi:hypothetical protein